MHTTSFSSGRAQTFNYSKTRTNMRTHRLAVQIERRLACFRFGRLFGLGSMGAADDCAIEEAAVWWIRVEDDVGLQWKLSKVENERMDQIEELIGTRYLHPEGVLGSSHGELQGAERQRVSGKEESNRIHSNRVKMQNNSNHRLNYLREESTPLSCDIFFSGHSAIKRSLKVYLWISFDMHLKNYTFSTLKCGNILPSLGLLLKVHNTSASCGEIVTALWTLKNSADWRVESRACAKVSFKDNVKQELWNHLFPHK
ncbi:hypothetical protein WN51_06957 [Melipona quadrifasciata]|uniref:Uncharacterized protein n=1 Tax=Melipona quadrifasciata TaxID=166423 RepID=A0A0M8ZPY4_9HYME|nr:hypothetical protein WN51_06957 [Melipona quadrifasciata]